MNELTIIKQNGGAYIDSRDVAESIGKRHDHLLRDIGKYSEIIAKSIAPNFGVNDFFLESSYIDRIGRTLPCYLISKMGCEMVANKLTGEKGVLFTAAYVARFNEMEQRELAEIEALIAASYKREPRLGEVNACARIIVRGMKSLEATPEDIMRFIKDTYEPRGFYFDFEFDDVTALRWYNAKGIAKKCGMYSLNGKPHGQAISSLLNEIIGISEEHKRTETDYYGYPVGTSTLYDDHALLAAMEWLVDNKLPDCIDGGSRRYSVQYIDI